MRPRPVPASPEPRLSLAWSQRLNREYFRIFRQIPLMLRLRADRRHGALPRDVRRMLIVDNALVGEFVVSLPAIRHLLDETRASVDLVVSPPCAPLARRMRGIDGVFLTPSVCGRETEAITEDAAAPAGAYDLVLVLEVSETSLAMLKRVRYDHIKVSLGDYLRYVPYVSARLAQKTGLKQIEDVVFDIVEKARTRPVHFDDVVEFGRHDLERVARLPFLRDASRTRVVVHTGSGWEAKLWSTRRWTDVVRSIDRLGRFQFLFVGGSAREERDCAEIRRRLPFAVHSIVRQADLADVALVMRQSDYFIGVDSGPRHIAHLLCLPSVCLLGPGPRMFSPDDRGAVYVDGSDCRCTTLFCHRKDLCMDRISVAEVLSGFESMLRASPARQTSAAAQRARSVAR